MPRPTWTSSTTGDSKHFKAILWIELEIFLPNIDSEIQEPL